ncbi:hypothetical protein RUM43_006720 [Polyplax serrata]|uniref:Uncharacterized protein n=1 Tax=Polyplax serrata TaxID=468196 RepID=A0AAN8S942_POLSC
MKHHGLSSSEVRPHPNPPVPTSATSLTPDAERFAKLERALEALTRQVSLLTSHLTAPRSSPPQPSTFRPQPPSAPSTYAAAAQQRPRSSRVPLPQPSLPVPKIPALKPAPTPKSRPKPAPKSTSYSAVIKAAAKRPAPPPGVRTLVVKGEQGKTVAAIRDDLQSALNPETTGIKVIRLREGKTAVSLTLADEASWMKVVNSTNLKARGLIASAPSPRQPRVAIYGVDRKLTKEQLVELVLSQNFERRHGLHKTASKTPYRPNNSLLPLSSFYSQSSKNFTKNFYSDSSNSM